MKKNKNNNRFRLLFYFFTTYVVVFLSCYSILFVIQREVTKMKINEVKINEKRIVKLEKDMLGKEFKIILSDLNFLHDAYKEDLLNLGNNFFVSEKWKIFSKNRRIYDQIRFIDFKGEEIIRINYDSLEATIVSKKDLQNKDGRYYFYETLKLNEKMVFISPLDLNIENGVVETPYKPMIRFSIPVHDDFGSLQGIIVLNYLAENILKEFRYLAENSLGEILLLNSKGYWISSENNLNDWNFMFEDKKSISFSGLYPNEWVNIISKKEQFFSSNGLYTNEVIDLEDSFFNSNVILGDGHWNIVSVVKKSNVKELGYLTKQNLLVVDLIKNNKYYFLFITLFSLSIGYIIYTNKKIYYEVKHFSEIDALTQVYNRRAGILKIQNLLLINSEKKITISMCYIDINGLKEVNDQLGHDYGDQLIITSIKIIKNKIGKYDFVIRLGGDEFIIIYVGRDVVEAEKNWVKIITSYNILNNEKNQEYLISLSHGIVDLSNAKKEGLNECMKVADERMYTEKVSIKNINI